MISVEAARAKVIEVISARGEDRPTETIDVVGDPGKALGRILAENVLADRNYPPFHRSIRDGYALRASDATKPGARLRLIGESRAGVGFVGTVCPGDCVRILTGAPLPRGANSIVMQEYAHIDGDYVSFRASSRCGAAILFMPARRRVWARRFFARGARFSFAELARAAEVGHINVVAYKRPRVAILSSGDELIAADAKPGLFQIRNSNSISIAAQVALAGGEAVMLGIASDNVSDLVAHIKRGLECDLLVLSGGVSVGTYDLVEAALQELGAEIFFDAVALRPGKPVVFGWCQEKPVFGLPGNPVSTMVTFELFVRPAIELLSGTNPHAVPLFKAKLKHPIEEKAPLSHFLPARVSWPGNDRRGRGDAVGRLGRYRRGGSWELFSAGARIEAASRSRRVGGCASAPQHFLGAPFI